MKIDIRKIAIIIIGFLYIYVPPLFPISTTVVLSVLFILYCFVNIGYMQSHINMKALLCTVWCYILMLGYLICVSIMSGRSILEAIMTQRTKIYILTYTISGMLCMLCMIKKGEYTKKQIWQIVITIGMAQAILAGIAYAFDPFQTVLCNMIKNIMPAEDVDYWRNWRLYGLSCSLTYGMPIVQAIIGGLACIYAKSYNAKYYLYALIIWATGIMNARVAIVVIAIEILAYLVSRLKYLPKGTVKKSTLAIFAGMFLGCIIGICAIFQKSVDISRITDPFLEIFTLLKGNVEFKTNGYLAYLYLDPKALALPVENKLIFGAGITNDISDIGYIINLWAGGIIYSIVLYLFYLLLLVNWRRTLRHASYVNKYVPVIYGIVLFVVNIKGDAFGGISEFINLLYLLMGLSAYTNISKVLRE